jgi:transposase
MFELTDQAFTRVQPLLPANSRRGKPWRNHRQVLGGILWKLRPWRDMPRRFGPWQICYSRLRRWQRDGTWQHILTQLQAQADAKGLITWEVSVDSTVARAHQHAAGARNGGTANAKNQAESTTNPPTTPLGAPGAD